MITQKLGCDIAGDGYCDDATNDGRCHFDGGDCCLPNKISQYCFFCICYADKPEGTYFSSRLNHGLSKNLINTAISIIGCWADQFAIGDGTCDGSSNTYVCNYDDGDCCLPEINAFCLGDECICHEDGLIHPQMDRKYLHTFCF